MDTVILALNETRKTVVASRVQVGQGRSPRLASRSLEFQPGEGLWLRGCETVDSSALSTPIDVVFLDEQSNVLEAVTGLRSGVACPIVAGTASILELPVGTIPSTHTKKGDRVLIEPILPEQAPQSALPINERSASQAPRCRR